MLAQLYAWVTAISKVPHICNTLYAKSRFVGLCQVAFWTHFVIILGAKIDSRIIPKSIGFPIGFYIEFGSILGPLGEPETLPKTLKQNC